MRFLISVALPLCACFASYTAQAQGPEFPAAARQCVTCHGRDGVGTSPGFPNLAGQKSIYLMEQLARYRDGRRQNDVMNIAAEKLTNGDIKAIAEYYEAQTACKP